MFYYHLEYPGNPPLTSGVQILCSSGEHFIIESTEKISAPAGCFYFTGNADHSSLLLAEQQGDPLYPLGRAAVVARLPVSSRRLCSNCSSPVFKEFQLPIGWAKGKLLFSSMVFCRTECVKTYAIYQKQALDAVEAAYPNCSFYGNPKHLAYFHTQGGLSPLEYFQPTSSGKVWTESFPTLSRETVPTTLSLVAYPTGLKGYRVEPVASERSAEVKEAEILSLETSCALPLEDTLDSDNE